MPLYGSVLDKFRVEKQALNDEAMAYDRVVGDDIERDSREKQLAALLDQKRLSENLETIRARRNNLELKARLQDCVGATRTNAVSYQVKCIAKGTRHRGSKKQNSRGDRPI